MSSNYFNRFQSSIEGISVPKKLNDPFGFEVPEIAQIASKEVQKYLSVNQHVLEHNFGFDASDHESVRGKMFGVLVVQNQANEIGYLFTCSGKIDSDNPLLFVPSVFRGKKLNDELTKGMTALSELNKEIQQLQKDENGQNKEKSERLKLQRKSASHKLQQWIFDHYHFMNAKQEQKSLKSIFTDHSGKTPPAGAGECAAPKLLQHAFEKHLKPLAIAEFWWGKTNKSKGKMHKEFYPSCTDKCKPILGYMLG